ncbi:phage protein Gp27 family protein [Methylomonas sp. 2BW1-5-20]|uniref:phage protein Gp27 family protein n=1 Tax=Methylomonas sp. 2BW1-5-20 TaxID=3376686 RepID=UPI00404D3628
MPPRSAIDTLPDSVLSALNERLIGARFSDYEGLAAWLQEQGFQISRSAVHRHGSALQAAMEKSIGRARERMEIAKAMGGMSNEDKAALLEASEMVAIDQLMDVLEGMQGWDLEDKAVVIPKLARAISTVGRGAVGSAQWRKDFEAEAQRKAREEAAQAASAAAKAEGVSEAGVARIREALGMAA